jgi:Tfp pilus assembly protein PilO
MNVSLRIWVIAAVAAVVAVVAGGWFIGVQPQLAAAATTSQNATGVEAQNRATMLKLARLTKAAAKVDSMKVENETLLKAVPTILKPNTFIRRITEVAALDGVEVKIVSPDAAVPYAPPASMTAAGSAPVGGGAPAPVLAKTDPMITAANFTVVPVTTTVTGTADSVLQFTHDIQNDQRTFAVTGLELTKDDKTSTVTAMLSGDIYTLKR